MALVEPRQGETRGFTTCARALPRALPRNLPRGLGTGLREITLLASLYLFYSLTRLLADDDPSLAAKHAYDVLHLEQLAGIDVEAHISGAVAAAAWLAVPASYWYAVLHYLVTPAAMLFVYLRRRADYSRVRNALVIGSLFGLAGFLVFPTAPPRMMPGAAVDVLAQYDGWGWWAGDASVPSGLGGLANQFAAMPSLHVGWALWVAWAVWGGLRSPLARTLVWLYPLGTACAVIATGNHWVLDVPAGAAVIVLGIVISGRVGSATRVTGART